LATEQQKAMGKYRNDLILAEQKSQDDYDKTLVSLSGGALGISLVIIEKVIGDAGPKDIWLLEIAWSLWAISLASVVASYFFSRVALRKTILQCDVNDFSAGVGGVAAKITTVLNAVSGISFVVGVVFIICFSIVNLQEKTVSKEKPPICAPITKGQIPPPPPPPKK